MNKKLYFVHIPKTAGNSVRASLREHNLLTNPGYEKYQREHHFGSRNASRVLHSHLSFKTPTWPSYLDDPNFHEADISFTVVRNPYDLLVSYYIHYIENPSKNWIDKGWANVNGHHGFHSFEEFIKFYCTCDSNDWHVPPLNRNLFGQMFDDNNKSQVDYAVHYENLTEGLILLTELLTGYRLPITLPKNNVSQIRRNRDFREFYTDELKELVHEKCSWEMTQFDYSFSPVAKNKVALVETLDLTIV